MTLTISEAVETLKLSVNLRKTTLDKERLDLQHKLAKIELTINGIDAAQLRLAELSHSFSRIDFCVSCFVNDGNRFNLKNIGGGTKTEDYMQCPHCDEVYSLPI